MTYPCNQDRYIFFFVFDAKISILRLQEQVLGSKLQKMQKKNKKSKIDIPDLADILEKIPTPSIWNTLPIQLPKWIIGSVIAIPSTVCLVVQLLRERKEKKKQEEEEAL